MKRLFTVLPRYAALFSILACAGGASPSTDPAPGRVDPPQMLPGGGVPPQLRIPASSSGRSLRLAIEVMIESTGFPDMATFKVSGFGAPENQESLRRWIQQVTFRPGQLDGQPVRALFRTKLEARVRGR